MISIAPPDSKGQLYFSAIQTAWNEVVKICPIVKPLLDFLRLEIIRSSGGESKEPDKGKPMSYKGFLFTTILEED